MAYINIYFSVINLVDNKAIILKYALFLKVLITPVSLSHAYVLNNYYYYYDERKLIE